MDFRFNEEQEELRTMARSFLEEQNDSDAIRKAMDSELGWEPAFWEQISGELGWASVHIPEAYGGLGLGYVELTALMEVMGESLVCAPFLSSVVLGANLLLAAGGEAQKQKYLPAMAEGQLRAAVAMSGTTGRGGPESVEVTVQQNRSSFTLDGRHDFVLDGHSAELLLVAARSPNSEGTEGISLFGVPAETPGVERRAHATMDQTRRLARVELNSVELPAEALLGEFEQGWSPLAHALRRSAVALAAEQVGGAQKCLDMSVAYALERQQFGRAIGSFQAIKHKCADMLVAVESARSAAYYAACVANEQSDELAACASLAKAYCSDAYFQCASDAIQIHGGVGFTWEYDIHLHFKRARSSEQFLGDPAHHRELVAREIGL